VQASSALDILLVDDDRPLREMLTRSFEREGHRVTAVADGDSALEAAAERWSSKGVVFIGINGQDLRGKALAFIDKHEITYPNVVDSGRLSGRYGVTGYPETFFVDADGTVTGHVISRVSQKQLDEEIRKALQR
jgi:CheY-like chemotaxis protein